MHTTQPTEPPQPRRSAVSSLVRIPILLALAAAGLCAAETVTVTVRNQTMQVFRGLGLNVVQHPSYERYAEARRLELARKLWKEGGFNCMRLWDVANPGEFGTVGDNIPAYYGSHVVPDAVANGVELVVLETNGCGTVSDHVRFYVDMVQSMRQQGAAVHALGFRNKPNTTGSSGACRWSPADVVAGIKLMRQRLDAAGLADVKLVGPETVEWFPRPAPEHAAKYDYRAGDDSLYLRALTADPLALAAIAAFGTQTYGKGITPWIYDLVKPFNKEYWVTICATDPIPVSGVDINYLDSVIAPVTAAQCLSDLNHGMTRWFGWAWSNYCDIDDNQSVGLKPRYYFMKNIAAGFDPGARVRGCSSAPAAPTSDMHFNYGSEPDIAAAAARNPDSSWAIGLVNLTGIHAQHYASYYQPWEGSRCSVTVSIPELQAGGPLPFSVSRCHGTMLSIRSEGAVTMNNGQVAVVAGPLDLVVLRCGPQALAATAGLARSHLSVQQHPLVVEIRNHILRLSRVPFGDCSIAVYNMKGRRVGMLQVAGRRAGALSPAVPDGMYLALVDGNGLGARPAVR